MLKNVNRQKFVSGIIVTSLLLLASIGYYVYSANHPNTDNAYVQAHTIYMAAQVNGPIINVYTDNYQKVRQHQLLFEVDPKPYQYAVDKAKADLQLTEQNINASQAAVATTEAVIKQREAELNVADKNTHRILSLVKHGQLPKAIGDEALGKLQVAKAALTAAQQQYIQAKQQLGDIGPTNARLLAAKAALEKAKLDLAHTKITAPADGVIVNFYLRNGAMITANQPLFALIEDNVWWVDANFKETDLEKIHNGQTAKITVDIYPNHTFTGKVVGISKGSGAAFSILPPENATGNWVKVTQRFPVRIAIHSEPAYPLRVGASCEVSINAG